MAYVNLIAETKDHVGLIRFDRPSKMNALNKDLLDELAHAVGEFGSRNQVRCLVLTGSDRVFSAGADIAEMSGKSFVDMYTGNHFIGVVDALDKCRKPIIAAVAGRALGGGCELAMMCDIIIAAEDAVFGQPEINIGVIAGIGGTQRLTRAVGKAKSMEMHLTGRLMKAEEAERSGLVSRVVPPKNLMSEVMALAGRIADLPPLAAMAAKEAVNRAEETSLSEGLHFERTLFTSLFATADQTEGMRAFMERRQAHYRGR